MSAAIVQYPASYVEKIAICLKAHSINISRDPNDRQRVRAAQNYLDQVSAELLTALENGHAAKSGFPDEGNNSITIEWCEANLAFAVNRNGKLIECFPSHAEAKRFANEIATGVVEREEAAEKTCG